MNWKYRISLVTAVVLIAAIWFILPSQADTSLTETDGKNDGAATAEHSFSAANGKTTQYPNGVMKIEPMSFGVSGKVRDMPTSDPDAIVKSMTARSMEELREERLEKQRKQSGIQTPPENEDGDEINELNAEIIKTPIPGAGEKEGFRDPLVKEESLMNAPQVMPTPSLTFDGATQADNVAAGAPQVYPPDVNGDVGPNHYVSSVNEVLKMYNKSGAVVAGPILTSAVFSGLPAGDPCRIRNDGDPIVMYDTLADRWHISQFGLPNGTGGLTYQCMAVSQTGDPTGAYYAWSYAYQLGLFNDYPKVGVWTDAYHTTFNQFNNVGGGFAGTGILSQDRIKALAGDPTASAVYVNLRTIDQNAGGTLPGDIDGYMPPPVGMAEVIGEFIANEYGDPVDGLRLFKWVPNFSNPASSSLTILPDLALAPFDARQPALRRDIEVLGAAETQYLDALSDRSMHRFGYRNFGTIANPINSYVGNFAVNVGGLTPTTANTYQTGIRWFEVRRSNDVFSVYDQGTHVTGAIDPVNGLNNWMGSIAQDNSGNIAVGFSQAGLTQRADIKIAGRTNNVPNSGTLNEGEALMYPSGGIQLATGSRWGDYSAMNPDPSDDCTFWYTQEYYAVSSNTGWSTRVGKFRFPQCTDAPKATISGAITFCENGAPVNKASVDATGGFNRLTVVNGTYTMTVAPGTYTVTGSKPSAGAAPVSTSVTVANGGTATANICITGNPVIVNTSAPAIATESCGANGSPDPGEQLSVSLPFQNTGGASTNNLTATLLSTGGITALNNPQSYGALAPGSAVQTRNFDFRVDSTVACGSNVTLTFKLSDGAIDYGTVTRTFRTGTPVIGLSENFDGVTAPALPAGWTSVQTSGTAVNWITSTTGSFSAPNNAFGNTPATTAAGALVSPAVSIPVSDAQISFKNNFNTETTYDGMVLEYSTDGGTSWTDVVAGGGSFVSGGYTTTIEPGSALAGRRAWSGNSGGYIDTVVNLPASLNGQSVRFRWLIATDSSLGGPGVRIDNVQVITGRNCNTCAAQACRIQRRSDFANDGKSDYSLFRPSSGDWFVGANGSPSFYSIHFGQNGDVLQPRDYDSDGKTDIAVFRGGAWYVLKSSDSTFYSVNWGLATDVPVAADYTGDGKADIAVYRPSQGGWYILRSDTNREQSFLWGGDATDVPVVGDFDGDCKSDLAVRRTTNASSVGDTSYFINGSTAGFIPVRWGRAEFLPAIGDYNGDGRADIGVVDPNGYRWFITGALPQTVLVSGVAFGSGGDIIAAADYNGDGATDFGVYRPNIGAWFTAPVTTPNPGQNFNSLPFGTAGDIPTARYNQYPLP